MDAEFQEGNSVRPPRQRDESHLQLSMTATCVINLGSRFQMRGLVVQKKKKRGSPGASAAFKQSSLDAIWAAHRGEQTQQWLSPRCPYGLLNSSTSLTNSMSRDAESRLESAPPLIHLLESNVKLRGSSSCVTHRQTHLF